jgi:hypothetical protein
MKTKEVEKKKNQVKPPKIVSPEAWEAARQKLLVKEKEYEFDGHKGKATLNE